MHIVANVHFCLGLGPSQNPLVCNLINTIVSLLPWMLIILIICLTGETTLIEFGDYNLKLNDYITYNHHDFNTRGKTINPHFNTTQFQNCYFNRMRTQVEVFFPSDNAGSMNFQVGHTWADFSPVQGRVRLDSVFLFHCNDILIIPCFNIIF